MNNLFYLLILILHHHTITLGDIYTSQQYTERSRDENDTYSGGHGSSLHDLTLSFGLRCEGQYFLLTMVRVSLRMQTAGDWLIPIVCTEIY